MNNITKIKDRIETIHRQINDLETHINDNPNDYSLKLNYNSLQNHLKDLYNQLNIENKKREKEIIELRFIGSKTKYGSIPLDIVSNLINYFSSVLHSTSYFIQYGLHVGYNKRKIVNDIIDLRLESIGIFLNFLKI
ncbi:MAG: hypothetical protein HZB41_02930 [Ignavibacteriae bacterium]|nr:hypothetical protein [Ignavibacteriota bacterium]